MHAFLVDLENRPGELARVTEAIAKKGVNLTGVSGATCGTSGRVVLLAEDEATTRAALGEANCTFTELETTEAQLRHQPGALATAARRLADAGINIEAVLPTGMSGSVISVAFVTDNPTKAREVLSQVASTSG